MFLFLIGCGDCNESASLEAHAALRAAADHDDGLPEQFWFALDESGGGCGAHGSSKNP